MNTVPVASCQRGITLLEVVMAVLLLSLTLVPMMDAFYAASHSSRQHGEMMQDHYRITSLMEEVLAEPYTKLFAAAAAVNSQSVATNYSDAPGSPQRRRVYLSYYDLANLDNDDDPFTIDDQNSDGDGNPFTGDGAVIEALWVRVDIENSLYVVESVSGRP